MKASKFSDAEKAFIIKQTSHAAHHFMVCCSVNVTLSLWEGMRRLF